jgi:hypothetical protein
MKNYLTPIAILVGVIMISITTYYLVSNKFIYVHCDKLKNGLYGIYAFNKNEFKWLYDPNNQSFKYKKNVIKFNKDEATYSPSTIIGNGQKITINRLSGTVTFSWEYKGEKKSNIENCKKIKQLPKLKAKF